MRNSSLEKSQKKEIFNIYDLQSANAKSFFCGNVLALSLMKINDKIILITHTLQQKYFLAF